jgi:cytochrome c oxidase assembly factor CtaG
MSEPVIALGLVAAAFGYGVLATRRWRSLAPGSPGPGAAAAFLAALVVLGIALASPLDGAAHRHLSAHMVQHVLLVSVAAPLIVAGRPLDVALPDRRWSVGRPGAVLAAAGIVQVTTLLVWHAPVLYDAALAHDPVHGLEHVSLLLTAVALWWALGGLGGEAAGAGVAVLFVISLPAMGLGVAMTLARTPWYPPYASGGNPLADQQLAGVVMWAYAGLAAVLGGVVLTVRWLARLERHQPGTISVAIPPMGPVPPC